MTPFSDLTAIAAPLALNNVDTDKILPGRFLKTLTRRGLGKALFAEMRYSADGAENADFVLNREPYRTAQILVAQENFGCGSSREHAPWALLDFGIRCVVAPSFADIFFANCLKNGILPVRLAASDVDDLLELISDPLRSKLTVSLPDQSIVRSGGATLHFEIDPVHKRKLLEGADEIDASLALRDQITRHEEIVRTNAPWIRNITL